MKQNIINESIRLFIHEGVEFKLIELATNLGISKKTIYKYFKNKEDLLLQSVDAFFLKMHEEQTKIFNDSSLNELDKLKKLVLAMPSEISSINIRSLNEVKITYPEVYKRIAHYFESDWEETFDLIDKCKEKGLIKNINNNLFKVMYIACSERIFDLSETDLDYETLQEKMVDILIGGIKNA